MAEPLLNLEEFVENDPEPDVKVNKNQRIVAAILMAEIVSRVLSTPPGSPAESALYFVAPTGTGAWLGQDNKLAIYIGGAWHFVAPTRTPSFWIQSDSDYRRWNGTAWVAV